MHEACILANTKGPDFIPADDRDVATLREAVAMLELCCDDLATLPEVDPPGTRCETPADAISAIDERIEALRSTIAALGDREGYDPEQARLNAIHDAQDAARKEW